MMVPMHTASDETLIETIGWVAADDPRVGSSNDARVRGEQALNQAMRRNLALPADLVARLLRHPRHRDSAMGLAVWCLDRDTALTMLRPLVDDAEARIGAAWALGRLRDTSSAERVLELLDEASDQDAPHLLVALARLDTPGVRRALARRARTVTSSEAYFLVRALRKLTGHSPLLTTPTGSRQDWLAAIRGYWRTADPMATVPPRVTWTLRARDSASAGVDQGRDVFGLDDQEPTRFSTWPLWFVSWTEAHEELYAVGSNCGTCEVYLGRTGWAPGAARELAGGVRESMADVPALTPGLLSTLEPVLAGCATGRYDLRLVDVRLTGTTDAKETWYGSAERAQDEDEDDGPIAPDRETVLYAARTPGGRIGALTLAPTQPASTLDEARVESFVDAIRAGARPAVLVAAHGADRYVFGFGDDGDRRDRSVTGFVLDGHHKLAAYDRAGVPARLLLVCDLDPRLSPGTDDLPALFDEVLDGVARPLPAGG